MTEQAIFSLADAMEAKGYDPEYIMEWTLGALLIGLSVQPVAPPAHAPKWHDGGTNWSSNVSGGGTWSSNAYC